MIFLAATNFVAAQGALRPQVDQQFTYQATNHTDNTYEWKIYNSDLSAETNLANYQIVSGAGTNSIVIKWLTQGTYYLQVKESDTNGCTNTKALRIEVLPKDNKVAVSTATSNQCYATTLNAVNVNLTFTDGSNAALPETDYPITVSYTLNGTAQTDQSVSFANKYITISGSSLSKSGIVNTNNVIVITGAKDKNNLEITPVTTSGQDTHTHTVNALPTSTMAVSDPTICSGTPATVTLTGSVSGISYQLRLDADDSTVGSAQAGTGNDLSFTVSPSGTTTYNILAANSTTSCSAELTDKAVVTVKPLPTLTVSGTTCSVDFTTYTINFSSNGTVTSTAGTVSGSQVTGIAAGTNVTLTATLDGCTKTEAVTAPDCNCPSVTAPVTGGNKTACFGTVNPALTVTVGTGETADWYAVSTGGTALSTGSLSYTSTETTAGTYTYYAETRNSTSGCKSATRTAVTLTINALPATSVITGNSAPACNATGITYNVSLTSGSMYAWTVPSGATITSGATGPNNNSVTVNFGSTNGDITVTETNAAGCVGTVRTLSVTLQGCGMAANFSGSPLSVCEGSTVTFTNTSTGTSGSTTYNWNFGDGASPATATGIGPHTVTYTTSGTKTVSMTVTDGASDTETKTNYITVGQNSVGGTISGGGTVTSGTNSTILILSGHTGTVSKWQQSIDGGANWTDIANTTTSLTATNLTQTTTYRAVIANGTCPSVNSGTAIITVTTAPANRPPVAQRDTYVVYSSQPLSGNVSTNDFDPDGNGLVYSTTLVVNPVKGTVVMYADGSFVYFPLTGEKGTDQFVYRVCDNAASSQCVDQYVDISFFNNGPVAGNDSFTTEKGVTLSGSLKGNDSDPDQNNLLYNTSPVVGPQHGSVVINANGTFTYIPVSSYVGTDTFTYRVCDDGSPSKCADAQVTITVTAPVITNHPPVAMNDINNTLMNIAVSGNVLTNDSDPDGDAIALITSPYSLPSNGTVVMHTNGTYTYTPDKDFTGEDFFMYVICEVETSPILCDTALVTVEVRPDITGNRVPVANEDEISTSVNKQVSGNILLNDFDPDMDNFSLSRITSNVKNGVLEFRQDGTFTYTPNIGFEGIDQFIYEICDDGSPSLCSKATVTITVTALSADNNPPFAADDAAFTSGDPLKGNVSQNDSDPDGDKLTFTVFSNPSKGTVILNPDGTYEYILNAGVLQGSDQFVYQVCDDGEPVKCNKATVYITIIVNRPPVAVNDDLFCLPGETKTGNVLINDSDPDDHRLTVKTAPVRGPSNGSITLSANGSFSYIPNTGFSGEDSVKYEVCDDGVPVKCAQATILITVQDTIVPDRLATNDINTTIQNKAVSGNVLTNDDDYFAANSVTTLYTQPQHGSVVLNTNGAYTYTPVTDYTGEDNFFYIVCTNDPPADCDTMKVTITVIPAEIKNGPVANNDETETMAGTAITSNLLSNDYSPSGEPMVLNVQPISGPSFGSVTINPDGTYTYTPAGGFVGVDQFVYEVCGKVSDVCSTAVVTISVREKESNLIFAADDAFFTYGAAVSGNILDNDIYESATLQLNRSPLVGPANGTVVINADGLFTYTPNNGYEGIDHFVYEICDRSSGVCDNATVTITVLPAPVQYADLSVTKKATPILRVNEEITFELLVTNLGNSKALNVRIADFLPGYIKKATYRIGTSPTSRAWTNILALGDMEVSQSAVIYINGIVGESAPNTITNLASVVSDVWDPNFSNNISVAKTEVNRSPKIIIAGSPVISLGCCNTEGVIIDASQTTGETGLRYRWEPTIYLDNPTIAAPRFTPGENTEYTLTVTDENGLKSTETVRVQIVDCPDAVTDGIVFVESPTSTLIADGSESKGNGISFRWWTFDGIIMNGQTNSTAQISGLGKYYLEVTDSYGCSNVDSLIVGQYIQAIADTVEMDLNTTIDINIAANDIPQGDIDPSSISIKEPPDHGIAVIVGDSLINYTPDQYYAGTDEFIYVICDYFRNCDEANVLVIINDQAFFAPDAFSPNGDGINDRFEVVGISKYNKVQIEIINRWGNVVYKSDNYGLGEGRDGYWDGTANTGLRLGQGPVPAGTYFYIIRFDNGEKISNSLYLDR